MRLASVEPDGTALMSRELGEDFEEKRIRFAPGCFFHPNSIYGDEPRLVPWDAKALAAFMRDAAKLPNAEALEKAKRAIAAERRAEDTGAYAFAASNRRIWEKGWRHKGLSGGRGSAKSTAAADYLLIRGSMERIRYVCVRRYERSIAESVKTIFRSRADSLGLGSHYRTQDRKVIGHNGTEFVFIGLDGDKGSIRSMEDLDGAWVEEAQYITADRINELVPTVRKPGSELIYSFNRVSEDAPVDRMFFKDKKKNALLLQSSYEGNPWLPYEFVEEILADRENDYQTYLHVWGGGPQIRGDAQAIRGWRVASDGEKAEIEAEIEADEELVPAYGADVGHTSPSAFVELFVLPPKKARGRKRLYIRREAYEKGVETDEFAAFMYGTDPHKRWRNPEAYDGIPSASHYAVLVDPGGGGAAVVSKLHKQGLCKARAVKKRKESVEMGLKDLNSYEIIISPDCPNAIYEAKHYRYKIDPMTGEPTEQFEKCPNHLWDAARYALQGVYRHRFPAKRLVPLDGWAIPPSVKSAFKVEAF